MVKSKKNKKSNHTPASQTRAEVPTSVGGEKDSVQAALEGLRLDGDLASAFDNPSLGLFGTIRTGTGESEDGEFSPRLLALQQQLERLDQDRYMLQRAADEQAAPLSSLNASATKTELSLQSLKKRLSEVRQQLYAGGVAPNPTPASSLANLAKSYFGGIIRNGHNGGVGKRTLTFPGEGEAFDEDLLEGEFEFEVSESEYYEEEILDDGTELSPSERLFDATRLGLRLFGNEADVSIDGVISNGPGDDLVARIETDLEAALEMLANANLPTEKKLEVLRDKFSSIIKQERQWRGRLQRSTRMAHEERIQRQLIEMELDKANAVSERLKSLCRDLQNENRRIKMEGVRREEIAAATVANIRNVEAPEIKMEFNLAPMPAKTVLTKENPLVLADRLNSLAEMYRLREQHFSTVQRQKDTDILLATEKADILATQLSKHSSALDASSRRISALSRSEQELKTQVRQYVEKFRQVEETLGKSNDLFGTFRAEMEQMGAKLARLDRENAQLNSKCATLSRNIIEMADERTKQHASIETLKGQKTKLEQLCRTLQAERNAALKSTPAE